MSCIIRSPCKVPCSLFRSIYQLCSSGYSVTSRVFISAKNIFDTAIEIRYGIDYSGDFYNQCKEKNIIRMYSDNEGMLRSCWEIRHGDTVLTSPPLEMCKSIYQKNAKGELLENLQLAQDIFQYVKQKVPDSPNYQSRTGKMDIHYNHNVSILKGAQRAKEIEKTGHGVCEDLAHVGKYYAREKYPGKNVEMVQIRPAKRGCLNLDPGRHVFLVIGRTPDSNPMDYKTWGVNAVILDSWAGKYYPLKAIHSELYSLVDEFYGIRKSYGPGLVDGYLQCPIVRHFNDLWATLHISTHLD